MIDGLEVTCIDCAMPMLIASVEALGVTGAETTAVLNTDKALRVAAGARMDMGDVSNQVTPKPVLFSAASTRSDLSVR